MTSMATNVLAPFLSRMDQFILFLREGLNNDEIAVRLAAVKSLVAGGNVSSWIASMDWKSTRVRAAPGLFPPDLVVQVKAWACELPATHDLPLSRWSCDDLAREVCQTGLVASVSGSTIWRWLHDAYGV